MVQFLTSIQCIDYTRSLVSSSIVILCFPAEFLEFWMTLRRIACISDVIVEFFGDFVMVSEAEFFVLVRVELLRSHLTCILILGANCFLERGVSTLTLSKELLLGIFSRRIASLSRLELR